VAVVNAGRTSRDYRLVEALASTLAASGFTNVYLVDTPGFGNTLIYATTLPTSLDDVRPNLELAQSQDAFLRSVGNSAQGEGNLRVSEYHGQVFTDDLAPVERLIDQIILGFVSGR
jgi:hypothetical protein